MKNINDNPNAKPKPINTENAYLKGRGAQINTPNRFLKNQIIKEHIEAIDDWT